MKKFKKIMAILVAAVMIVAMAVPAWAATITINQDAASSGVGTGGAETYVAYKVFDVTKTSTVSEPTTTDSSINAQSGSSFLFPTGYAYTIDKDSALVTILRETAFAAYVTLTASADGEVYNVEWVVSKANEDGAKEFADLLLSTISVGDFTECNSSATGYGAEAAAAAVDKKYTLTSDGTAATSVVDDGYYLITSSLGTNLVVATSNITITTKNDYITDKKDASWTNFNVGDKVKYTITVNIPASTDYDKPIVVHDTLSEALKINLASVVATKSTTGDFTANVAAAAAGTGDEEKAKHRVVTGYKNYDFTITATSLKPAGGAEPQDATITITYEAELTIAATGDGTFTNKEFTEYSKYKTQEKTVDVTTFDFDLEKVFTGDTSNTSLQATFELFPASYTESASGTYYKLITGNYTTVAPTTETSSLYDSTTQKYAIAKGSTAIGLYEETANTSYVRPDAAHAATGTTITVKQGTSVNVRGLSEGTYYLVEKSTSNGYKLLTDVITVVIDNAGNVSTSSAPSGVSVANDKITVTNETGKVLPSTGGMGTTVLYIVGGMLIVLAGAYLFFSRKRTA